MEPGSFRDKELARRAARLGVIKKQALKEKRMALLSTMPPLTEDLHGWIDDHLTPRVAESWWLALQWALETRDSERAKSILIPLTAICQRLTSGHPKNVTAQITQQGVNKLRNEHDMSEIDTETLRRVLGKAAGGGDPVTDSGSKSRNNKKALEIEIAEDLIEDQEENQ